MEVRHAMIVGGAQALAAMPNKLMKVLFGNAPAGITGWRLTSTSPVACSSFIYLLLIILHGCWVMRVQVQRAGG